jgi:hypothetical protein
MIVLIGVKSLVVTTDVLKGEGAAVGLHKDHGAERALVTEMAALGATSDPALAHAETEAERAEGVGALAGDEERGAEPVLGQVGTGEVERGEEKEG